MTPDFRILANGNDITDKIQRRLLSLRVIDEAGFKSDSLDITLDDRDHALELPAVGATLDLALGYKDNLVQMGIYTVDGVRLSSPPAKMQITAKAANFAGNNNLGHLQTQKTRSWEAQTLAQLVNAIAGEHNYRAVVAKEFESIKLNHIDQTYESDINLLVRLATEHGAVIKVTSERLCCVKEKEAEKANGQAMPTTPIAQQQVTSWNVSYTNKSNFAAVETRWHDKKVAKTLTFQTGDGKPVYQHTQIFASEDAAKSAAYAQLKRFAQNNSKLSLKLIGNMEMAAERKIELGGFREGVDGLWVCQSVTHELTGSGFVTQIQAEKYIDQNNKK